MERHYHASTLDFEDEYIPSGNWYPQSFDDTNSEPFFPENCPSNYTKASSQQGTYHTHPDIHPNYQQDSHDSFSSSHLTTTHDNCPSSSTSSSSKADPFSVQCRIPVPELMPVSGYQLWLETSFMCRRNERERQRVRSVNDGFSRLRNHLPRSIQIRRRQSKVETLRHAITYIKQLQMLVDGKSKEGEDKA